jgi:hypothetical protein
VANTKISALPDAGTITGTEEVALVQGGTTKRATVAELAAGLIGASGAPSPLMTAGVIGKWYLSTALSATSTGELSHVDGTLVLGTPRVATTALTISHLGAYVNTGGAGSVLRFGIYTVPAANPWDLTLGVAWATLLVDGGTVVSTGSGETTLALGTPQVIAAGTAFVVGVVPQGNAVGLYTETLTGMSGGTPWGETGPGSGPLASVKMTGVSGALPATFTPGAFGAVTWGTAARFKRSA